MRNRSEPGIIATIAVLAENSQRLSAAILVAVNIAVAVFALTREYGYAELLLIYFAETVVIGVLNVPKLMIAAIFTEQIDNLRELHTAGKRALTTAMLLFGYAVIFSIVWMLLYLLIMILPILLNHADRAAGLARPDEKPWQQVSALGMSIAALALSHVASFVMNFLLGREFRGASFFKIAVQPVLRTAWIIGVIAIAAAFALIQPAIAQSTAFAVVVIVAKITADWFAHRRERRRFQSAPA